MVTLSAFFEFLYGGQDRLKGLNESSAHSIFTAFTPRLRAFASHIEPARIEARLTVSKYPMARDNRHRLKPTSIRSDDRLRHLFALSRESKKDVTDFWGLRLVRPEEILARLPAQRRRNRMIVIAPVFHLYPLSSIPQRPRLAHKASAASFFSRKPSVETLNAGFISSF